MADKKSETKTKYYDDGKIEYSYAVDQEGNIQGPYESYYKSGQLKKKCVYKDGEYDGPLEEYYENGQLFVKCTYKEGKKDGLYESYWTNGKLCIKCIYKEGKMTTELEGEKSLIKPARKAADPRLVQMDKQMTPTQLRQNVKRAEVARFRAKYPNKNDGR